MLGEQGRYCMPANIARYIRWAYVIGSTRSSCTDDRSVPDSCESVKQPAKLEQSGHALVQSQIRTGSSGRVKVPQTERNLTLTRIPDRLSS